MAEAVLCLPVLLLLFMGIAQLALLAWTQMLVSHAARSAARSYAVFIGKDLKTAEKRSARAVASIMARVKPAAGYELKIAPLTAREAFASETETVAAVQEEAAAFIEAHVIAYPKPIFPMVARLFPAPQGGFITLHGQALVHSEATEDRARERDFGKEAE